MRTVLLDPVTRIEGHLAVRLELEQNRIAKAYCAGEMFRGFEQILKGRDPLDAQVIVQRICGVCPVSHGVASVQAQEQAYKLQPSRNGVLLRNLILGANYLQSHILHFYHLAALDFVDIAVLASYSGSDPFLKQLHAWLAASRTSGSIQPGAPFLPRYSGSYAPDYDLNVAAIKNFFTALDMRRLAHKMAAVFAGKMPHPATLIPGGVTSHVTAKQIAAYLSMLDRIGMFVENCYIPDVLQVAKAFAEYFSLGRGPKNFLAYGGFPVDPEQSQLFFPRGVVLDGRAEELKVDSIGEELRYAFFEEKKRGGETDAEPAADKAQAYSWVKAPRYQGEVMEVGPAARLIVATMRKPDSAAAALLSDLLKKLNLPLTAVPTAMGRHLARAVESKVLIGALQGWAKELRPGERSFTDFQIPAEGKGIGCMEAPRGALGHWLNLSNYKIGRYQCIVPTTWNCSPRDDRGTPGAVESALEGLELANPEQPLEAARVIRSFDPCLACAVH